MERKVTEALSSGWSRSLLDRQTGFTPWFQNFWGYPWYLWKITKRMLTSRCCYLKQTYEVKLNIKPLALSWCSKNGSSFQWLGVCWFWSQVGALCHILSFMSCVIWGKLFNLVRRLLRVPWTARRSNQSILKEISPGISLEGMMLKLKLQYFGQLMQRVDS